METLKKSVSELIEAALRFLRNKSDQSESEVNVKEHSIADLWSKNGFAEAEGNYSIAAQTGERGVSHSNAYGCCAVTTGMRGMSASEWGGSIAGSTGFGSVSYSRAVGSISACTGTDSLACGKGSYGIVCNSGFRGRAMTEGGASVAIASGFGGEAVAKGEKSIALVTGRNAAAKGELGSCLVFVDYSHPIETEASKMTCKAVIVDGQAIKPDTYYSFVHGEIVEQKDVVRPARVFERRDSCDD